MSGKGKPGKATRVALAVALAASAVPADAFASDVNKGDVQRYAEGGAAQVAQGGDLGPVAEGLAAAAQSYAEATVPLDRSVYDSAEVTNGRNSYRWTLYTDGALVMEPLEGQSSGQIGIRSPGSDVPWEQDRIKNKIKTIGFSGSLRLVGFYGEPSVSAYSLFSGLINATSVDLSGLDTSSVTDMGSMFSGCSSLSSLDLSGLDTSKVTNMYGMFYGCTSLSSLDLSGLDTSNVTDMGSMFYGCSRLSSITLGGGWRFSEESDLPSPTNPGQLFTGLWVNEDSHLGPYFADHLISAYNADPAKMAGTWTWEREPTPSGKEDFFGASISGVEEAYPVGTAPHDIHPVVAVGGKALREGVDYEVSYRDARDKAVDSFSEPGLYELVATGAGGYFGEASVFFEVSEFAPTPPERQDISQAEVSGVEARYLETGSPVDIHPTVTLGGKTLAEGTDYEVSYCDSSGKEIPAPSEPGSYRLVLTGKRAYAGEKEVSFAISSDIVASGEVGQGVTWDLYAGGLLSIKGSGDLDPGYSAPWAKYSDDIKAMDIGSGVTFVGAYTFNGLDNLWAVFLHHPAKSNGRSYIDTNAFGRASDNVVYYYPRNDSSWEQFEWPGITNRHAAIDGMELINWKSTVVAGYSGDESFWVLGTDGTSTIKGSGAADNVVGGSYYSPLAKQVKRGRILANVATPEERTGVGNAVRVRGGRL